MIYGRWKILLSFDSDFITIPRVAVAHSWLFRRVAVALQPKIATELWNWENFTFCFYICIQNPCSVNHNYNNEGKLRNEFVTTNFFVKIKMKRCITLIFQFFLLQKLSKNFQDVHKNITQTNKKMRKYLCLTLILILKKNNFVTNSSRSHGSDLETRIGVCS